MDRPLAHKHVKLFAYPRIIPKLDGLGHYRPTLERFQQNTDQSNKKTDEYHPLGRKLKWCHFARRQL